MAKEILLYTSFNSWSVSDFITSLEDNKGTDIIVRMNTPGGSVYDGYGAIAKFNEFKGNKSIKVDGRADSFGAFFVAFCPKDSVECLDVSTFTFHRAAMPTWFEADANYFTDEVKGQLNKINTTLRAGIESKVTAAKWKSVTGISLDDMFSLNSRIDVSVDADKMKKMGMVGNVIKLTPKKIAEIKAYSPELAAEYTPLIEAETEVPIVTTTTKINKMTTIQDVKANSEIYAAIKAEIIADEKERIAAFAEFSAIDPKAVLDAIVKGDKYTPAFGAKMQVKAMSAEGIKNLTAAAPKDTNNEEAAATAKSEEEAAFEAQKKEILKKAKAFNN